MGSCRTHCYDAFWDPAAGKTTRYLMSGYGFVAVGDAADKFFTDVIREHMRRHYFQMGLIAHCQAAALLTLSERLSHAAEAGEAQAADIHKSVLHFTHHLWFPDVSNHIQGREMFARWRGFLRTEELYAQVMREAQDAYAFHKARTERRTADSAANLNLIATVGLALSLVACFLGMNVVVPQSGQTARGLNLADAPFALRTLAVVLAATGMGLVWLDRNSAKPRRLRRLGCGLVGAAALAWLAAGVIKSFQ